MGRLGERKFDDLCDLAGLAVSTLLPDMTGKDRYVEFPLVPVVGTLTYDTRPAPLACYVQIKTLLRNNRRFGMRLSAAERLAHETKPAFVVVLRVDDRNKFVDMYLIHIDGSVLAAILKRLRMEQAKNSQHLNRKTISFSISAGQKVDVAPNALRDALITAIGPDMLAYTARKHRQTKELGFDPVRFNVKIGFAPLKIEHFVDGLLGLVDLPVKKFEAFERRFGIALPASPVVAEAPDSDLSQIETAAASD